MKRLGRVRGRGRVWGLVIAVSGGCGPEGSGSLEEADFGFLPDGIPEPLQEDALGADGLLLDRLDVMLSAAADPDSLDEALALVDGELLSSRPGLPWVSVRVPLLADLDEAEAVAAELAAHPAMHHVAPSRVSLGPRFPEDEAVRFAPEGVAADNGYLGEQRFYAAWNAAPLATSRTELWFTDVFSQHTAPKQVPGLRFVGPQAVTEIRDEDGLFAGNHGLWTTSIAGGLVDAVAPTGTHPDPATSLELVGVDHLAVGGQLDILLQLDRELPTDRFFVLNASTVHGDETADLDRVLFALLWRTVMLDRSVPFLTVAASGNEGVRDPDVAQLASVFVTQARFDDLGEVLEGAEGLVVEGAVALVAQTHGEAVRRRAGHTLVVGAAEDDGSAADFSNEGAQDFRMIGVGMLGSCARKDKRCIEKPTGLLQLANGTSASAPMAAGLAAWLRALDPTLTAEDLHGLLKAHDDGRWVDALSATLALESRGVPVRRAWLDYFQDGAFDANDVVAIVTEIEGGDEAGPDAPRTWPRGDLNGDGRASSTSHHEVDLDGNGRLAPIRFDLPAVDDLPAVTRFVDEAFASDLDVLCWGAYAGPFTGDAAARDAALAKTCRPGKLQAGMRLSGVLTRNVSRCESDPPGCVGSGTSVSAVTGSSTLTVELLLRGDGSMRALQASGPHELRTLSCVCTLEACLGQLDEAKGTLGGVSPDSRWTPDTLQLGALVTGSVTVSDITACGRPDQAVTVRSTQPLPSVPLSFGSGTASDAGAVTFSTVDAAAGATMSGTLQVVEP